MSGPKCELGCTAQSNCKALRDGCGSECPATPFQLKSNGDAPRVSKALPSAEFAHAFGLHFGLRGILELKVNNERNQPFSVSLTFCLTGEDLEAIGRLMQKPGDREPFTVDAKLTQEERSWLREAFRMLYGR